MKDFDYLFTEFQRKVLERQNSLKREDCPWSNEEFDAYMEGYRAATSWAVETCYNVLLKED